MIGKLQWRDMKNFLFARASAVCFQRMSSSAESVVQYISPAPGEFSAYRKLPGKSPGVIFLPGLMSNMEGTKALALERYCRSIGHSYVRFDYRGHGMSSGTSQDCTIGMRKADVLAILDKVAKGKLHGFRILPSLPLLDIEGSEGDTGRYKQASERTCALGEKKNGERVSQKKKSRGGGGKPKKE